MMLYWLTIPEVQKKLRAAHLKYTANQLPNESLDNLAKEVNAFVWDKLNHPENNTAINEGQAQMDIGR